MNESMIEPVVKRITVPLDPSAAFELFTTSMASWWPLASHSVGGDDAVDVRFDARAGGRIVERTKDGVEHVWGTVRSCAPSEAVTFTWHPGREPSTAQEVEVTFAATGGGCSVTLIHRGWEALGEAAAETRDGYDSGWAYVFGECYAQEAGR